MELATLLKLKPSWAYEPCLYIIRQTESIDAFRCGASGTQLYKDADRVFGADRPGTQKGLLSRSSMYLNMYQPLVPMIYAALRIKKQLVALQNQRTGTDFIGNIYNIDRQQTLVLAREKLMHDRLDQRGLRWDNEKKNELFVPRKSVQELISVMRTIPGEEMYLFDKNTITEDTAYRGGRLGSSNVKTFTSQRTQPDRELKDSAPTITLKLSKRAIEELKMGRPKQFDELVDLVKLVANIQKTVLPVIYDTKPVASPPTEIIRLPKSAVEKLRGNEGPLYLSKCAFCQL